MRQRNALEPFHVEMRDALKAWQDSFDSIKHIQVFDTDDATWRFHKRQLLWQEYVYARDLYLSAVGKVVHLKPKR
jgi:hypothetical protein